MNIIDEIAEDLNDCSNELDNYPANNQPENEEQEFDLKALRLDLSKEYPPIEFLFSINGVGAFPKGDIQAIKAKAKHGKTYSLISQLAGAMSEGFGGVIPNKPNMRILHVDTEQAERNVSQRAKVAIRAANQTTASIKDKYFVYPVRKLEVEERPKLIQQAMLEHMPDWVIIDGIVDLIPDFNDTTQSKNLISHLLRLSSEYSCAITCVLHENKSVTDGNMRGHLGTELANKASEVYKVEKNEKDEPETFFKVSQTECRNKSIEPWYFKIEDKGVPIPFYYTPTEKPTAHELKKEQNKIKLESILKDTKMKHTDLVKCYSSKAGLSEPTTKKHIKEFTECGVLLKGEDGFYSLCETSPF